MLTRPVSKSFSEDAHVLLISSKDFTQPMPSDGLPLQPPPRREKNSMKNLFFLSALKILEETEKWCWVSNEGGRGRRKENGLQSLSFSYCVSSVSFSVSLLYLFLFLFYCVSFSVSLLYLLLCLFCIFPLCIRCLFANIWWKTSKKAFL